MNTPPPDTMRADGDAYPVLLLAPLGVPASAFADIIGAVSAERPVIEHEHPGHGLASFNGAITIAGLGERVIADLDRKSVNRVSICGFGFGGMVALWIAAHHPERTAQLCVACSSATPGHPAAYLDRASQVRSRGIATLAAEIVTAWVTPLHAVANGPLMRRLEAVLASVDPEAYAACCEAVAGLDLTEDLARIDAPTLILAGSQDRGLAPEHSRRLVEAIRDATYCEVAGAAHLPWLEQPDAVLAAIRQHLRGTHVHTN